MKANGAHTTVPYSGARVPPPPCAEAMAAAVVGGAGAGAAPGGAAGALAVGAVVVLARLALLAFGALIVDVTKKSSIFFFNDPKHIFRAELSRTRGVGVLPAPSKPPPTPGGL